MHRPRSRGGPYVDDPEFSPVQGEVTEEEEEIMELIRTRREISGRPAPSGPQEVSGPQCVEKVKPPAKPRCSWPILGPKRSERWANRLLLVPELKFAFCYIEKNACTQFNLLANRLNRMANPGTTWWTTMKDLPFWKSNADKLGVRPEEVTHANGWRTGVFLREPAERFASA